MVKRYVFLCTRITEKRCMEQKVFGLAGKYLSVVKKIRKGDRLFVYNFDSNILYGVFKAASDGAEKISPSRLGRTLSSTG